MRSRSHIIHALSAILALSPAAISHARAEPDRPPSQSTVMESLPSEYQARIESRNRALSQLPPMISGQPTALVLNTIKRWPNGHVITVAFLDGDNALRAKIAGAAQGWLSSGANITFDFGNDANGNFRSWSMNDVKFAADVRISFNWRGYWSLVGTDSSNATVIPPGMPSMNFQGFTEELPPDWAGVVRHEFGHALGCEHEHQSPAGDCEDVFRFDDDPGYFLTRDAQKRAINDAQGHRPGIYTVLANAPNFWPKDQVDYNLRRLPPSSAYDTGTFDPNSIMKYWFAAWMFKNTTNSCFTPAANDTFSKMDLDRIALFYPQPPPQATNIPQKHIDALAILLKEHAIPKALRDNFQERSDRLTKTAAP